MFRIAVYDDNKARREGLKVLIEAMDDMICVGTYIDCSNILFSSKVTNPDVILMDINMPNVNGIEGLKLIKAEQPQIKVIMQTISEDEGQILEAICAGTDGYIIKQKSPMKLIEGIKEVMNGGAPMTPTIAAKVLKLFNSNYASTPKANIKLTKRELQILKLLVDGYSYKMIADMCDITYATVNKHITNIYQKLQVHSVAAAVSKAIKQGIV